jgi:23S rRNA (uracil1939-C5)-methyltransferase
VKPETLNLKVDSMTQGGEAMGRDETGRVIFVPYAIAGEEVLVEIVERKKSYARARLVEIRKPSPARIVPRCPHFGRAPSVRPLAPEEEGQWQRGCGGCQWQHIAYPSQLEWKTRIVREQFARIGKIPDAPVRETLGMTEPWDYRNHTQFHVNAEGQLCYRALESHDLVRIRECFILEPPIQGLYRSVGAGPEFDAVVLRAGVRTGQKMVILEGKDQELPEVSVDEPVSIVYATPQGEMIPLIGRDAIHEELHGRVFRISPGSFFQVNTTMAEKLVDLVERYLAPQPADTLLDAFGGVGTFGLLLAPRVARVLEIEESPGAVEDAHANAVDLTNVEFHVGRVEDVLPRLNTPITLAVADPPRAGIDRQALDALIARGPRNFAYVSCDPATLARDARRLVDASYRLVEVQPVDLFPQTYHIESVSWFGR